VGAFTKQRFLSSVIAGLLTNLKGKVIFGWLEKCVRMFGHFHFGTWGCEDWNARRTNTPEKFIFFNTLIPIDVNENDRYLYITFPSGCSAHPSTTNGF